MGFVSARRSSSQRQATGEIAATSRAHALGRCGEDAAAALYESDGARIVARNVRYPVGEIDIIVDDDGLLIFVEVKTRSSHNYGTSEHIDARKLRCLRHAAAQWLRDAQWAGRECRFDVVVTAPDGLTVHQGVDVYEL